jgi:hypothetical protein
MIAFGKYFEPLYIIGLFNVSVGRSDTKGVQEIVIAGLIMPRRGDKSTRVAYGSHFRRFLRESSSNAHCIKDVGVRTSVV